MDVRAKKCQRLRRRVEDLEKAVFSIWGYLKYLWQASGRGGLDSARRAALDEAFEAVQVCGPPSAVWRG